MGTVGSAQGRGPNVGGEDKQRCLAPPAPSSVIGEVGKRGTAMVNGRVTFEGAAMGGDEDELVEDSLATAARSRTPKSPMSKSSRPPSLSSSTCRSACDCVLHAEHWKSFLRCSNAASAELVKVVALTPPFERLGSTT